MECALHWTQAVIAEEVENMKDPRDVDSIVVHALEYWSSLRGLIHLFLCRIELPNVLWSKVWIQGKRRNQDLGDLDCRRDFVWHAVCRFEYAADEVRELAAEVSHLCEVGGNRHVVLVEIRLRVCQI